MFYGLSYDWEYFFFYNIVEFMDLVKLFFFVVFIVNNWFFECEILFYEKEIDIVIEMYVL